MSETLLSISEVLLFGRVMEDIKFEHKEPAPTAPSPRGETTAGLNSDLYDQLKVTEENLDAAGPRFARIYGFSYEGTYYDLDAPTIMLVHGPGAEVKDGTVDTSGEASKERKFATDIRVWSYDKGDFSIRMESVTGSIEDILLDVEIGAGVRPVSGGKVSGGKVAGGKVAGGKVAGGKVAGGKVVGGKVNGD